MSRPDLSQWLRTLADGLDVADPTDADGSAATARDWAEAIDATNHLAEYLKIEFARGQVDDEAAVSHEGPEGLLVADYAIRLLALAKARGAFKVPCAGARFARTPRWVEVHPDSPPVTAGTRPVVVSGGRHHGTLATVVLPNLSCVALPDWATVESDESEFYEPHLRRMVQVSIPTMRLLTPLDPRDTETTYSEAETY